MEPEHVVKLRNHSWRQLSDARSEAAEVNGYDLFC